MTGIKKSITRAVVVLIAAATVVIGVQSTPTSAKPRPAPVLLWTTFTDNLWGVGANGCTGLIRVVLKTDPREKGVVWATLIPGSFVGAGPGWQRRPVCTVDVFASMNLGEHYIFRRTHVGSVIAGPRGGKPVTKKLRPGSGLPTMVFEGGGISFPAGVVVVVP